MSDTKPLPRDLAENPTPFQVISNYQPAGDQPQTIMELAGRVNAGEQDVVPLGAAGTREIVTTAQLIESIQCPTLALEPNKTLAAQLTTEFRKLLPKNAVEYFVSYYDYYQPETYVPRTDTYIGKGSSINNRVGRLRHSATNSLLTRRDVMVVGSVSCIYGLDTPEEYVSRGIHLSRGMEVRRDDLIRHFVGIQYNRNDVDFTRGDFRVRGDIIDIIPMCEELGVWVEFSGDEIDALAALHPVTNEVLHEVNEIYVFPASHYIAGPEHMERAVAGIEVEMESHCKWFHDRGKLLEEQHLWMRTTYDLEMMRQIGICTGIENYSLHVDGRQPSESPHTLFDHLPDDFLLVADESHVAVP